METDEVRKRSASAPTSVLVGPSSGVRFVSSGSLTTTIGAALSLVTASAVSTAAVAAIAMHDEDGEDVRAPPLTGQTAPVGARSLRRQRQHQRRRAWLLEVPQPMALTAVVAAANR